MATPITYCTVEGCERRCFGNGLCQMHYARMRRHGSVDPPPYKRPKATCQNCGKPALAHHLCPTCYQRWLREDRTAERHCTVADCHRPLFAKELCAIHYDRHRRLGTTELATPEDRFWTYVDRQGPDDCWLWTGARTFNYGAFWNGKRLEHATRFAYRLLVGEIPPRRHLHHLCHNPPCVNPAHLQVLSPQEHIRVHRQ